MSTKLHFISLIVISAFVGFNPVSKVIAAEKLEIIGKPEIIEVFACSDYCPAPKEQHMVKAYKGVADAAECLEIGGKPYEYVGWGQHFVCIAEE